MMMTPAGHTWTLVNPISGQVGQAGYTPAYTATLSYSTPPSCLDTCLLPR